MRTHYIAEVNQNLENREVTLCGWVHEIRDLGKIKFLLLRDISGLIQVTAKKDFCDSSLLEKIKSLNKESVIRVLGIVKVNEKAPHGVEIFPREIELISKAETPLPLDVTEKVKAELDTRLNNRFLDLRKPEVAAIFKIKSWVLHFGREFLRKKGFIEVYTPKIIASASEGGTELFPISYFDKEAFLAQSPQLYKQMLMASGFDRVFEIATYFRAEEHDTRRHLNEVTAFDIEMSFIENEEDVMKILEGLVHFIIKNVIENCETELKTIGKEIQPIEKPILRLTYSDVLELLESRGKKLEFGDDLDTESEKLLGKIVKEEYDRDIYFIKNFPLETKPFYTMPLQENDELSRSFDLGYKGVEISSGSQRIHNYELLCERIKAKGLNPENFEFYLKSFRYGMPPHGGFGLGIERLMMQLLDVQIREVMLFPRDRHRLLP